MRDAIHAFKYDGLRPAARRLGRALAVAMTQLAAEVPAGTLVVPVPLHRQKYAGRGFNQARLLAEEALSVLRKTHPGWHLTLAPRALLRQRATRTQADLTPHQRRLNMRGAFRVARAATVAGRNILLVDDILTTGATARAATRALRAAGARAVWVATLARARRTDLGQQVASSVLGDTRWIGTPGSALATVTQGMQNATNPPSFLTRG